MYTKQPYLFKSAKHSKCSANIIPEKIHLIAKFATNVQRKICTKCKEQGDCPNRIFIDARDYNEYKPYVFSQEEFQWLQRDYVTALPTISQEIDSSEKKPFIKKEYLPSNVSQFIPTFWSKLISSTFAKKYFYQRRSAVRYIHTIIKCKYCLLRASITITEGTYTNQHQQPMQRSYAYMKINTLQIQSATYQDANIIAMKDNSSI